MAIGKTSKKLLISLVCGSISFVLFIWLYGSCSWGGCGDTSVPLTIIVIFLIISIIFFLIWLWDILKQTFANRENEASEETEKKRSILLSTVSVGLLGNAIYNIYHLERVFEIVRTEVLYSRGIQTFFIIFGAIGIWLHRRWGVLITATIILIIALPIIWNNIVYARITSPYLIIGYITAIIILVTKFKDMK